MIGTRTAGILFLSLLLAGCAERELEAPPMSGNLSTTPGDPLMPTAEPKFDPSLLADPAAYKPLPPPRDAAPLDLGFPTSAPASAPAGEASSAPASEPAEGEEAPEDEASDFLLDEAREPVVEIPDNPGGRSKEAAEKARDAALEEVTKELRSRAASIPLGDDKTLGDLVGGEEALAGVTFNGLRTVAMSWLDPDTLSLEVEISIADLAASLKAAMADKDFEPLTRLGEGRQLPATGTGVIPEDMRSGG
jgi:hypothetical protein